MKERGRDGRDLPFVTPGARHLVRQPPIERDAVRMRDRKNSAWPPIH
jgi:hypothetical protein